MRAVLNHLPEHVIEDRRRKGIDGFDEMWEGVLHMNPPPSIDHQDFEYSLCEWLMMNWARPFGNRVHHQGAISIAQKWTQSFRTPDLVLLTPEQFHIDQRTHFNGPPLVAVEIYSPGDESYEKLPFYAEVGVPEIWIIDRDSKRPEIHRLNQGQYEIAPVDDDGWVLSESAGIRLKATDAGKLVIELVNDANSRAELPT
jgi:Uma2 family endonuclease